jgi:hypothetical protein
MATRPALVLSIGLAAFILIASVADGQDKRAAMPEQRADLTLFADPFAILQGNEFQCIVVGNWGNICNNIFTSPFGGGGVWPAGTANQYLYNTGIQIAGIVGADGGPWAGDTTGAFFFDPRGTQSSGTALAGVYDSTDPDDLAEWPAEARVADDDLFRPSDIGRAAISEQDTWTRYWDGDPSRLSGRPHPLGIAITQRSLQWHYPSGAESVIYFIFDIANVSAVDDFQSLNEAEFFADEDMLPNEGYTLAELYVALAADMDVTTRAGENFSSAILPLELSVSYHGGFDAPEFAYPPELHYPPFFVRAPGIVGTKFLTTPRAADGTRVGVTFWTETVNSFEGLRDPVGVEQLWRYLSGNIEAVPGETTCNVPPEIAGPTPATSRRSVCWTSGEAQDTRYTLATGPFELPAGDTQTIAVAYVVAPTLETLPDGTPIGIVAHSSDPNANPPGVPSFHPGFPSARGCTDETATDCTDVDPANEVRPIERAAGWVSYDGPVPATALESPAQKLEEFAVETATHSLLDRALVVQAIFDAKFLLPRPPEPPEFYLLPGDGAVTILWEPSPTDGLGDPYFALASDPQSVLYNRNYREFDVIAYELWRGASPDALEPIGVFRHSDRFFIDRTCELVAPSEEIGNPAGAGYAIGEECPADYERESNFPRFFNNGHPGGRPGKGVVRASSGGAAIIDSLGALPLSEWGGLAGSGVPFLFRDTGVTNNFTYFYAVTAVDLNSPASGPPVQRSTLEPQSVLPRTDAPNLADATIDVSMTGDDGVPLESPGFFDDDVDRETGIFPRAFPPTDAFSQTFAPLVPRLLPALSLGVTIDSIVARHTGNPSGGQEFEPTASGFCAGGASPGDGIVASPFGACWDMYLSVERDGSTTEMVATAYNPWWSSFGEPGVFSFSSWETEVGFDAEALEAFGLPGGSSRARLDMVVGGAIANSAAEGPQNRRFGNYHSGARWFDGNSAEGAVNSIVDPARYRRVGHLTGVDTIFAPIAYTPSGPNDPGPWNDGTVQFEKQCFSRAVAFFDRAADLVFDWRGAGRLSVRDVTHNVDVPFSPRTGASWGFLTSDANGNGVIDWHDFNYIDGALPIVRQVDGGFCNAASATAFDAGLTATPVSLRRTATLRPTSTAGMDEIADLENGAPLAQTGAGFGLYVNGHRFIFELLGIPGAGTEWTLRTFRGSLRANSGPPEDPAGYSLDRNPGNDFGSGREPPRPGLIPGLTFRYDSERRGLAAGFPELDRIHTVPDPYLHFSAWDGGGPNKRLVFVNLPPQATVRIYTLGGVLVDVVDHDDPTGGGRAPWDLRNRDGRLVASGPYFWHVVTPGGEERVGKFTIVNPHRD